MIYQFIPIGDYCSGLLNFLNSLVLLGLLVIIVFVFTILNVIKIKKGKEKFDFIPLILVLFFCAIWYFLVNQPDKKFWTKKALIGIVESEGTPKSGTLVLFENGSFGASYHDADYSCTYQGDYEISESILVLNRADLTELTNEIFTTEYVIHKNDSVLKPLKEEFMEILITKQNGTIYD